MIATLDVHYNEVAQIGKAAAIIFHNWENAEPMAQYTAECAGIQPYQPGEFFRRELPCLLAVLENVREPLGVIVIDGYVALGEKPGLGTHLWEALGEKVSIIGVAKTRFHGANAVEVIRGSSKTPPFVTAMGLDVSEAAENIRRMHGPSAANQRHDPPCRRLE